MLNGQDPFCQDDQKTVIPNSVTSPRSVGSTDEDALLYLYSNNSTENNSESTEYSLICALQSVLSSYQKRQAETLHLNVARLISLAPSISHIGFMTLTFKDNVTCPKEAYNRFRSFNSHFLSPSDDFGHWICVKEPQKRGAWHYHLLITVTKDIRIDFDWDDYKHYTDQISYDTPAKEKKRLNRLACRSANPELKKLWSKLRMAMPRYNFGRSELLPIRTGQDQMARYLGKYIGKALDARSVNQKGVRLVSYSTGWVKNSVRFQWHTEGSKQWRKKLQLFAAINGCEDFYELTDKLGTGWAYKHAQSIVALPCPDQVEDFNALIAQYQFLSKPHDPSASMQTRASKNQDYWEGKTRPHHRIGYEKPEPAPLPPYDRKKHNSHMEKVRSNHDTWIEKFRSRQIVKH